jgi:hypothetical protein
MGSDGAAYICKGSSDKRSVAVVKSDIFAMDDKRNSMWTRVIGVLILIYTSDAIQK